MLGAGARHGKGPFVLVGASNFCKGGGRLSWCSDYTQFYLIDAGQARAFGAPEDITNEMTQRRYNVVQHGLVVYTADCLRQEIAIAIHDSEPTGRAAEPLSGKPWTQTETVAVRFASSRFAVSSPSASGTEHHAPQFNVVGPDVMCRICWLEDDAVRYDTDPTSPDVISIEIWPR